MPQQPNFLHAETFVMVDTRDHRGHPTSGGVYRTGWSVYSDRNNAVFTSQRYEAEAAQFIPIAASRVVFALHAWFVASATATSNVVPFYLMPSLGGANTLRAYTAYRFHDRNLALVNAEARVPLFTHVDVAAFGDAGNVAARVSGLGLAKRSYGAGLRVHTGKGATLGRLDLARGGDEGWVVVARMNDPLRFGRLTSRLVAIPFAP
jgi:outer membrane protein assembly factor BamA